MEFDGGCVFLEHFDGGWVEGCFAALGGGDCELDAGFVEDFPGVGEFGLSSSCQLLWEGIFLKVHRGVEREDVRETIL